MNNSSSPNPQGLAHLLNHVLRSSQARSPLAGEFDPNQVQVGRITLSQWRESKNEGPIKPALRYTIDYPQPTTSDPELSRFVQRLRLLAFCPELNRLNHVRQLSTAYFSSAIAAGHSRLEHILGAFETAAYLFFRASEFLRTNPTSVYAAQGPTIIRAGLLIAFFHDVFHAPFGHVLDPLRPVLFPRSHHGRLDKAALEVQFHRARMDSGTIHGMLNSYVYKGLGGTARKDKDLLAKDLETASEILGLMLSDVPQDEAIWNAFYFVFDILDSRIDHDRLDYVVRDSAHVFHEAKPVSGYLNHVRFASIQGRLRMVFDSGIERELNDFLSRRRMLYNRVYEAREKAPYDEMIRHAIQMVLRAHDSFRHFIDPSDHLLIDRIALGIVQLSDSSIVQLIRESPPHRPVLLARLLIQDIFANAPFVVAGQFREIQNGALPTLGLRYNALDKRFKDAFHDLISPSSVGFRSNQGDLKYSYRRAFLFLDDRIRVPIHPTEMPTYSEIFGEVETVLDDGGNVVEAVLTLEPLEEENLYWMMKLFGGDALYRYTLEQAIWERVQRALGGEFEVWASSVAEEIAKLYRMEEQPADTTFLAEMVEDIKREPLIFLAMTRPGSPDVRGQVLMDIGKERETLVLNPDTGTFRSVSPDPPDEVNNYWLAALRPRSMPVGTDKAIDEALGWLIDKRGWIEVYVGAAFPHSYS